MIQKIANLQKHLTPVIVRRMEKIPVIILFEEHSKDIIKYSLPLLQDLITGFRPQEILMVTESTGLEHGLFTNLRNAYPKQLRKASALTEFTHEFTFTCIYVISIFLEVLPYIQSYPKDYKLLCQRMRMTSKMDILAMVHDKLKMTIQAYMTKILQSVAFVNPRAIEPFQEFMQQVSQAPYQVYAETFENFMKKLIGAFAVLLDKIYPPCKDGKFVKLLKSMTTMNNDERVHFITKLKTNLRAIRDRAFINRLSEYVVEHPDIKLVVCVFGTSHFPNLYRHLEKSMVMTPHPLTRLFNKQLKKQDITKRIQDKVYSRILAKKRKF
jgi:hypothetical protein